MKLKDLAFIGAVVLLLAPFFLSNDLYAAYLPAMHLTPT